MTSDEGGIKHQTNATRPYNGPSQSDRKAMAAETREPRTYFEIEQGKDDSAGGSDLPAPSYGGDPTGREPPLGQDVNALPDMRVCWWVAGAGEPSDEE